jgi:glycosidase
MQWDATENAGFSTAAPWIRMNGNYREVNVEKDRLEDGSVFQFYQKLIALRKENEVLTHGQYVKVRAKNPKTIVFLRELEKEKLLIIISLSRKPQRADISNIRYVSGTQILGTHGLSDYSKVLQLKPYEGRIYRLE